ncbi:hypothetical protein HGRIS_006431 [Hohenbuehelia grisea]|uniref:Uncharacterized protein n=1 Tax=Hohenbuehelia grisea TaxID=104357 RepID=A0ABR3JZV6_9AGAR
MSFGNTDGTNNVDRDRQTESAFNDFSTTQIVGQKESSNDNSPFSQTGFRSEGGLGGTGSGLGQTGGTGFSDTNTSSFGGNSDIQQTGFQPTSGLGDRDTRETGFQDTTSTNIGGHTRGGRDTQQTGFSSGGFNDTGSGATGTGSYETETVGRGVGGTGTGAGYGGGIDAGSETRPGRDTAGIDANSARPGHDSAGFDAGSTPGNTGYGSGNRGGDSDSDRAGGVGGYGADRTGNTDFNESGTTGDRSHGHGEGHKTHTGPSMGDKIKGSLEKTAGKITGNADMQARGEERKASVDYHPEVSPTELTAKLPGPGLDRLDKLVYISLFCLGHHGLYQPEIKSCTIS